MKSREIKLQSSERPRCEPRNPIKTSNCEKLQASLAQSQGNLNSRRLHETQCTAVCDVQHVSHIGSSTICRRSVIHNTMWAPVHIISYSFSPTLWSAKQNFYPNATTAEWLLWNFSSNNSHAQYRVDVGHQYIPLKPAAHRCRSAESSQIHPLSLTRGEILLNTHH